MKLSDYAKKVGLHYSTVHRHYTEGKLKGHQLPSGTIIINEDQSNSELSEVKRLLTQILNKLGEPKMLENLKTEFAVLASVIRGRSMVETLVPKKRNRIEATIIRADGTVEKLEPFYNSRVNTGASWQASVMGSAAGVPANYIALSGNVLSPASGDSTLSGEIVGSGLTRTQGTYGGYTAPSGLGASASYQISYTFTATGSQSVNSSALFNQSAGGSLFCEANLSNAATLASGDQLQIIWQVNI